MLEKFNMTFTKASLLPCCVTFAVGEHRHSIFVKLNVSARPIHANMQADTQIPLVTLSLASVGLTQVCHGNMQID